MTKSGTTGSAKRKCGTPPRIFSCMMALREISQHRKTPSDSVHSVTFSYLVASVQPRAILPQFFFAKHGRVTCWDALRKIRWQGRFVGGACRCFAVPNPQIERKCAHRVTKRARPNVQCESHASAQEFSFLLFKFTSSEFHVSWHVVRVPTCSFVTKLAENSLFVGCRRIAAKSTMIHVLD